MSKKNKKKEWTKCNQTKINRADVRERAALFDDGNYSLFIHWGLYPKIANKWKHTTYFGISE
jgi:alpha-L-fucosidase